MLINTEKQQQNKHPGLSCANFRDLRKVSIAFEGLFIEFSNLVDSH